MTRLTHQRSCTVGVHTVHTYSVQATFQEELHDVVHAQPRCDSDGCDALKRVLRSVERVEANVWTRHEGADDVHATLCQQRFMGSSDIVPTSAIREPCRQKKSSTGYTHRSPATAHIITVLPSVSNALTSAPSPKARRKPSKSPTHAARCKGKLSKEGSVQDLSIAADAGRRVKGRVESK